jgi:lipoprotein NlpD
MRLAEMCFRDIAAAALLLGVVGCASQGPAPVGSREEPGLGAGAAGRPDSYQVVRGDSLYSIAWRYDLNYHQIAACNGISAPYLIYPGQVLRLCPTAGAAPRPALPVPPTTAVATAETPKRPSPVTGHGSVGTQAVAAAGPATARPGMVAQSATTDTVTGQGDKGGPIQWIWPTHGEVVQTFVGGDRTRQGIRIAGTLGQDVVAAAPGRVVYSGSGLPGYGKLIIIKHNKNYLSAYGFNRKLLVQEGSTVTGGERVAEMGSSADGKPMLHFEIRRGDAVLDPLQLLPHH